MTDSLKVKASKAVYDARVATHATCDAKVAAHITLKDADVEAHKVSDDIKTSVSKSIADARIAIYGAKSKFMTR
jgi:hypothetical protein